MPCININLPPSNDSGIILSKLNEIVNEMATLREIMEAARTEQDAILAANVQTKALMAEVKQLLQSNDVAGAQQLLDDIIANSEALVNAAAEQATLTAEVDAANGAAVV
jgi:hypothetical protein